MPNMSYCMFENTANDLEQVLERMEEVNFCANTLEDEASSVYESESVGRLIELCKTISDNFKEW